MASEVIFEKKGKTAYLTLNRPDKNNAINLAMRKELANVWKEIDCDSEIWSVILTGGEKVFSTGQDVPELTEFKEKDPLTDLPLNSLETFGLNVKKPVIAAISGYCLGFGFLMTMVAGDIRIASSTAKFGMPEVKIGVPPSLGIPAILANHFPPAIAMELLLLGKMIDAETAYQIGYVNKIVSPDQLISTAEAYAEEINQFSPLILKNIKEVFKQITFPDQKAMALSNALCLLGRHSEDYLEGPRAFKEKRKPIWKGR
jgi:dehydration protein DpgD